MLTGGREQRLIEIYAADPDISICATNRCKYNTAGARAIVAECSGDVRCKFLIPALSVAVLYPERILADQLGSDMKQYTP